MLKVQAALLIAALASAVPLGSQQPNPQPPASTDSAQQFPTIHVTARTVILDVIVTDDTGKPVTGLDPSAFTLLEDGKPQKLSSFEEHNASNATPIPPAQPLPPNTFAVHPPPPESITKTLIILDQLHYPSYPYVRADILAFMKSAPPGHPIAIVRLDWQGLHFIQNFTADTQTLQQVVASKAILPPPPALDVHEWTDCVIPYRGVTNPYGRLARFLDGVPGRINLAWVTDEGEPDSFLGQEYSQLAAFTRDLSDSGSGVRLGRVSFYAIKAGGYIGGILQPWDPPEIPVPQIIPQSKMPPNPVACPLMPAPQGSLLGNQALADAAAKVGGHAFFDGATKALSQIMDLGSDYYTLSYVPSNPKWNGMYRTITINIHDLPKAQPETFGWSAYSQSNIVYRRGYYASSKPARVADTGPTSFGLEVVPSPGSPAPAATTTASSPVPATLQVAMGFGSMPASQLDFTIAAIPSPSTEPPRPRTALAKSTNNPEDFSGARYRNYQLHYWVDPRALKFSRTDTGSYRDDLRFAAIVYGDDGQGLDLVSASTHLEVAADDLESILTSGVTFTQTVAVPIAPDGIQDRFFIRTGVMELSTGHIGVIEVPTDQITILPTPSLAETSQKTQNTQ